MQSDIQVASARAARVNCELISNDGLATVFGTSSNDSGTEGQARCIPRTYNTVPDEKAALYRAVEQSGMFNEWTKDPIDLHPENSHNLQLARGVAFDVLSEAAGEAPSERIFSIASRVMGTDFTPMSDKHVQIQSLSRKICVRLLGTTTYLVYFSRLRHRAEYE